MVVGCVFVVGSGGVVGKCEVEEVGDVVVVIGGVVVVNVWWWWMVVL